MPAVGTIDLRDRVSQSQFARRGVSRQLHQAIEAALRDGGQVILLLNRRGFLDAHSMSGVRPCRALPALRLAADASSQREDGDLSLLRLSDAAADGCPECHFDGIHFRGLGTQRLEAEIRGRFPERAVLRMDTDTMQAPGSHDGGCSAFRDGEVQILLGTQMIAKGLDFPNVTLVGVVNADTALHLPDFRAAERTFQLVTQVAGRTGRGEKGGRVLVQTFQPEHPAIQAAVQHDFARSPARSCRSARAWAIRRSARWCGW